MPVLPDVGSISVSHCLISPRFSASSIIESAGRSFTDPAGLLPSSLPSTTFDDTPGRRCRRTTGVLPTVDASVGYMAAIGDAVIVAEGARPPAYRCDRCRFAQLRDRARRNPAIGAGSRRLVEATTSWLHRSWCPRLSCPLQLWRPLLL